MPKTLEQRIRDAALELSKNGSIVTAASIAEILEIKSGAITYILRRKYDNVIDDVRNRLQIKIPSTQALREDLNLYKGNLYEARNLYDSAIKISKMDWFRDIKIPLSIDDSVAELLGIYWALGSIARTLRKNKNNYIDSSFVLYGKVRDRKFFRNVAKPLIKKHHNLEASIMICNHNAGGIIYDSPRISLSSQAIITWLTNILGFPEDKDFLTAPKIDFSSIEIVKGYLKGVIEASYSISSSRLALSYTKPQYLMELKKLFEALNIKSTIIPRKDSNSYRLDLSREGTTRLKIMGLFNPI